MAKQILYVTPKNWLTSVADVLCKAGANVVAPVEDKPGVVNFAPVASADAVASQYGNVEVPLKRLFFPATEVLLRFSRNGDGDTDVRPERLAEDEVVVLGCRPCDTAALAILDKVFRWDYDDLRYSARRERTTLVTWACSAGESRCFCASVGGSPHDPSESDVIVFGGEDGGEAIMQALTDKGEKVIERLGGLLQPAPEGIDPPQPPQIQPQFDPEKVKGWLDDNFESDFWAENSRSCLGCGACSYLCPTCHCFDIVDEATWNQGERRRNWDCCACSLFTLHASGHNPRPDRPARCRQRLMHKFKYFPERFDRIACVGCGRCVKVCGAGRSIVSTLAEIESK